MKKNIDFQQVILIVLSLLIILYSISLLKYDIWIHDLFYFTELFGLIIAFDFFYFTVKFRGVANKSHLPFCLFPIGRIKVLWIELISYVTRPGLIVFALSTLWLLGSFCKMNNVGFLMSVSILVLYLVQLLYLISFLILMKNITKSFKDFFATFIFLSVLLTVFSEKSGLLWKIFLINPINNGFLAIFSGENLLYADIGALLIVTIILMFIGKSSLRAWPLSRTQSSFL